MTGVICTIKLDPFYQQFLRVHHQQFDPVFRFPRGLFLSVVFREMLSKRGKNEILNYGKNTFKVEVPFMEKRSTEYWNYMSAAQQELFELRVATYWRDVYLEKFRLWKKTYALTKDEMINKIMDEYGFDPSNKDRITRDYQRFCYFLRVGNYRERKKLNNVNLHMIKPQITNLCNGV